MIDGPAAGWQAVRAVRLSAFRHVTLNHLRASMLGTRASRKDRTLVRAVATSFGGPPAAARRTGVRIPLGAGWTELPRARDRFNGA